MKNYILPYKSLLSCSLTSSLTNVRFFKKRMLLLFCLFLIGLTNLYGQPFYETETFGGIGTDGASSIAIDEVGNQYITGIFNQTIIVKDTLVSNGQDDILILKKNQQNEIVWTQQFGSSSDDESTKVVYQNGYVYTIGFFWDDIMIDTIELQAGTGGSALYVAKWDTLGQVQWARTIRGDGIKSAESLAIGKDESVFVIGYFNQNINSNGIIITGNGVVNSFLSEYDSSGNFMNLSVYGETSETRFRDIQIDTAGNIYILGAFDGQVTFDNTTLTSGANDLNAFLLKIGTQNTNQNWIQHLSGVGDVFPQRVVLDDNENVYTIGYYINSLNFSGTQTIQTPLNDHDVFVGKYRTDGRFVVGKTFGGSDNEFAITSQLLDKVLMIGGYFIGDAVFETRTLSGDPLVPRGFAMYLDTSTLISTSITIGDIGFSTFVTDIGFNSLTPACCQDHWLVGNFEGQFPVSISPVFSEPSKGSFDFFMGKKSVPILTGITQKETLPIQIFPNPADDFLNINIPTGDYEIMITNTIGQVIFCKKEWINEQTQIPIDNLNNGLFFIKIIGQNGEVSKGFMVNRE